MGVVRLGQILHMQKGKIPISTDVEQRIGFLPYVDIKAFEKGKVDYYTDGQKCLPCQDGDLLIVCDGSRSGLVGRAKTGYVGSTLAKIRADGLTNDYLAYFLQSKYRKLNTNVKGTGTPHVNPALLKSFIVPVPSFTEQERIVARIEELFSELDKGVETLQKTKAHLIVYRQAVLKDAFTKYGEFEAIRGNTQIVTSGSRGWAKYYSDNGALFIRIGNLTRDRISIDYSNVQYVTLPDKAEGTRCLLQRGDVLVSITADLGSIGYIDKAIGEAYINQHIALVRFNNTVQSEFFAWFLRSEQGQKDLLKNKRGAGKLGLGLDDIRDAHIPVVADKEAISTLEEIESRLSVCDKIEQTVDETLIKSESLRQSILKKAFEGKLV